MREEMEFQFFGTTEVREHFLNYGFQESMPDAIPLSLDGSGNFAVLDVRCPPVECEYPVLLASAANLGFEDAALLGDGFMEFCFAGAS